jgi:hypothetical protein
MRADRGKRSKTWILRHSGGYYKVNEKKSVMKDAPGGKTRMCF